jgi:hypothetical protein
MAHEFQTIDYSYLRPTSQILDMAEKLTAALTDPNGKRIRFYGLTPNPTEQEKIDEFLAKASELSLTLPDWWTLGDSLRYLTTKKTIPEMIDKLIDHTAYLEGLRDFTMNENMARILRDGYVYIGGRDREYFPYIVANLKNLKIHDPAIRADLMATIKFVVAIVKKYMMLPGFVEKYHFILNVEKLGVLDAKKVFPDVLSIFGENNGFAGFTFIVNPGWAFRAGWGIISAMLPDGTKQRTL